MNKQIEEVKKRAAELLPEIQGFLKAYQNLEDDTNREDLTRDEETDFVALYTIADELSAIPRKIKNLSASVTRTGVLIKNGLGRYEVDGYELTSGSPVEVLRKSDNEDVGHYVFTRIEHSGDDYYAVDFGTSVKLDGMLARIKAW